MDGDMDGQIGFFSWCSGVGMDDDMQFSWCSGV